jgi:predicted N-acyltransferase
VKPKKISLSVVSSILDVSPSGWDACNLDAMGPEKSDPFLTHGFLSCLQESGSAVKVRNHLLHTRPL